MIKDTLLQLMKDIRDERGISKNTALRVGSALVALVQYLDEIEEVQHAQEADHALTADDWIKRPEWLDQPVRTTDHVKLASLTVYSTSTEGAGNGITEGEESEILEIPANDVEMSLGELTNVDPATDTAAEGAILVKGSDGLYHPNSTLINNLSNKVYTLDINDTPQNMFTLLNANRLKKFIVIGVNETDGSETFDAIVNYTPISIRVSWYEGFVFNTLLLEKIGDVIAKEISYINLIK